MQRVAAGVHHGAAGKLVLVTDVAELGQREAHRRADLPDGPEVVAVGDGAHAFGQRVIAVVESLDDGDARCGGSIGDLPRLGGVGRERLFAQHMLARGDRRQGPFGVQPIGERVVDGVDLRVGDEVGIRRQHPCDAVLVGVALGAFGVTGRDGHDVDVRNAAGGLHHRRRGNLGRAQNADPQPILRRHASYCLPPPCCRPAVSRSAVRPRRRLPCHDRAATLSSTRRTTR